MIGLKVVDPHVEFITPKYFPQWDDPSLCLIEECGRVSHKSENRIKDGSAKPFIKRIAIGNGHINIVEHFHFTVCFTCSRSCSHQIVRSRISSITQESMRYCDYSKAVDGDNMLNIIIPPSIGYLEAGTEILKDYSDHNNEILYSVKDGVTKDLTPSNLFIFIKSVFLAYETYLALVKLKVQAEDARYVLPHCTKTEVYMTMNYSAWRNFFKKRMDKHAQWEIRKLANDVFNYFLKHVPTICEDMKGELE